MFNEDEDWNDEEEAQVLSKTVVSANLKSKSSEHVKSKAVGKKSLLRTLQTLGSVPDWKSDERQQGSDSDGDSAVTPSTSKRKKKRRKRQKLLNTIGQQQENGELQETPKEEKIPSKKRKKGFNLGDQKTTSEIKKKDSEITSAVKVNVNEPETTEKLSRKQWKNKMKNKRKCKNKYRPKDPEKEANKVESAENIKPKEEVKAESFKKKHSETICEKPPERKGKECKPQKRKNSDSSYPTKTQTAQEDKKTVKRNTGQVGKDSAVSSDGSNPRMESTDDQEKLSVKELKPKLDIKQRLKREKLRKMLHSQEAEQQESLPEMKDETSSPEEEKKLKQDRSASLRSRMEQRLDSARFRYINEVLYSTSSGEAKRMFKQDPQAFWIYHKGYTAQVQRWPTNPVDDIIAYIQQKPSSLVVADFGCGDCKIARSVKNRVHSFDLAATCELVTVCDMANVPLPDASVGIAVFCLSLMGVNLVDFLAEANRVLKNGGFLKIAEVASRFDNVRSFISALSNLGFNMVSKNTENTHFYTFEFVKTAAVPQNLKKIGLQLKPCVYKKR